MELFNPRLDRKPKFEANLIVRDANGNPTGTRNFVTDSGSELEKFYLRLQGKPKKKRKIDKAATAGEASKVLQQVETYIQDKFENRKSESVDGENRTN